MSLAEQAIEARRRQISSFGADARAPPPRTPERPPSPIMSPVSPEEQQSVSYSSERPRPRSPVLEAARVSMAEAADSSWNQLQEMNDTLEWRMRPDGRSPSPPNRHSPQRSVSPDSSMAESSRRRSFEPVSADQRILQRLENPERVDSVLEEDWAERGEYTFHPLAGTGRAHGPDGKMSVLARAKKYLHQHAGLPHSAAVGPEVVERLLATEVTDGYLTAGQARKVNRQVGEAQIMAAFNAIQAASFARRNTPAPKQQHQPENEPNGILSPETRVLLDAGLTMKEVNSLKEVGALGSPKVSAGGGSTPKKAGKQQGARASPARQRLLELAKPREPGGFGRGRSPERHERERRPVKRASIRPKPKEPVETEPLEAALERSRAADDARAAANRATKAAYSAGAGDADWQLRPAEPVELAPAAPQPPAPAAFGSFLSRAEEWSTAREQKAEEKRKAVERRAASAGTSKRLGSKELEGLVHETTARQEEWERQRQTKLLEAKRKAEADDEAMRTVGAARKVITASEANAAAKRQKEWEAKRRQKLERARKERDELEGQQFVPAGSRAKSTKRRGGDNTQVELNEPVSRSLALTSPAYAPSPPRAKNNSPRKGTPPPPSEETLGRIVARQSPSPREPEPEPEPEVDVAIAAVAQSYDSPPAAHHLDEEPEEREVYADDEDEAYGDDDNGGERPNGSSFGDGGGEVTAAAAAELREIAADSAEWLSTAAELLGETPAATRGAKTKSKIASDIQQGRTWAREAEAILASGAATD